jgi:hypothetical protein
MLRIDTRYLEFENSLYYYENQLFTGIGFRLDEGVITNKKIYQDGILSGEYTNNHIDTDDNGLWVDMRVLEGTDGDESEPLFFKGKLFSGVACDLNGHFCVSEKKFQEGECCPEAHYSFSGLLIYLDNAENGLYQQYEWFKNGLYKKIILSHDGYFDFELDFTREQRLSQISIEGDYFKDIQSFLSELIKEVPITDCYFSDHIKLSSSLYLASSGITDVVFNTLKNCEGFSSISDITLFLTSISAKKIELLKEFNQLKYIKVKDRRKDMIDAVTCLKLALPRCMIVLNNEEI